ncbi:MAG: hypothetical protein AAF902_05785 [Chloroflexota bacterium]
MNFTSVFNNCKNEVEIKKLYKKLAKENHPDLGGSDEAMKSLNAAYKKALAAMDGKEHEGYTYRYRPEFEEEVMQKLQEILGADIGDAKVSLMGIFIWVTNTKKEQKNVFNKNGLKLFWSFDKKCWYWKPKGFRSSSRGNYDFESIVDKYGETVFKRKPKKALAG